MNKRLTRSLSIAAALLTLSMGATAQNVRELVPTSPEGVMTPPNAKSYTLPARDKDAPRKHNLTPGESIFSKAALPVGRTKVQPRAPRAAVANVPEFRGAAVFSVDWISYVDGSLKFNPVYGIYNIPTTDASLVSDLYYQAPEMTANYGAVMANSTFRSMELTEMWFWSYPTAHYWNIVDGEFVYDGKVDMSDEDFSVFSTCATVDPTTGYIYGVFRTPDNTGYQFGYQTDIRETTVTTICPLETAWSAIGITSKGDVYALSNKGMLMKVEKATGKTTDVAHTGLVPDYETSGLIDPKTDTFYYWLNNDEESSLVTIDLKTAKATTICTYSDAGTVLGAYIPTPLAEDKAPAAPENLVVDFEKGQFTGEVTFNVPATLFDGTAATGQLNYALNIYDVNGDVVETYNGEASYGSTIVTITVDMSAHPAGLYTFTVTTSNAAGESPKQSISRWIGPDVPAQITDVNIVYNGKAFEITWPAIDKGFNNEDDGYFDPKAVTYTVTRYPDAKVVAKDLKVNKLTDNVTAPTSGLVSYYYIVAVNYNGEYANEGESNHWPLGYATLPYVQDFVDENCLNDMFTIDANGDGNGWVRKSETIDYDTWEQNYFVIYAYNYQDMTKGGDDWLITPAVKVEKGKYYEFVFDAAEESNTAFEKMEAFVGSRPTEEAMLGGTRLLEETIVQHEEYRPYSCMYQAKADGVVYFGIHCISDAAAWWLKINNIRINLSDAEAPAAVTNVNVIPDSNTEMSALITFNMPTTLVNGEKAESFTSVDIYREGELVGTITEGIEPGVFVKYIDSTVPKKGLYTWTVVANNEHGSSPVNYGSAFVGQTRPAAPENFVISCSPQGSNVINMTWDEVTLNYQGFPMAPNQIRYKVGIVAWDESWGSYQFKALWDNIAETSLTVTLPEEDMNKFVYYILRAYVPLQWYDDESPMVYSNSLYMGPAQDMPVLESFTNNEDHTEWLAEGDGTFGYMNSVKGVDDEKGVFVHSASYSGDQGWLTFRPVKIPADAPNPCVSYFSANPYEDGNENRIYTLVSEDAIGWRIIDELKMSDITPGYWTRRIVSLEQYKGTEQYVALMTLAVDRPYTLIDRITISNIYDYDLAGTAVVLPEVIPVDQLNTINANIFNDGLKAVEADDFSISLFRNNEEIAKMPASDKLNAGSSMSVSFTDKLTAADAPYPYDTVEYYAIVNFEDDADLANNATPVVTSDVEQNPYPGTVLNGKVSLDGEADLYWSEPVWEYNDAKGFEDDFEDYEPWASVENKDGFWQVDDLDQNANGSLPGHAWPNKYDKTSFFVVDVNAGKLVDDANGQAHSGDKYIASIASSLPNNDWIISKALDEGLYMLTFWAKSYSEDSLEAFNIRVSDTGNETDDFGHVIFSDLQVPAEWTEYNVLLPEGTKYFAIQCTSNKKVMFMVDDVKVEPIILSLEGYNIYRDGVCLNEEPLTELNYVDGEATIGEHAYILTVVWDKGESQPSNIVKLITTKGTGISTMEAGSMNVAVQGRNIIVTGEAALQSSLISVDGKVMGQRQGERAVYTVEPGIYLVKAQGKTVRVIVR